MFDWIPIFVVYENQNFLLGIDLCFFSSLVLSQIIIHKSTTITKYTSQILKINVKPSNLDRTKIWQFHEIIFSKKILILQNSIHISWKINGRKTRDTFDKQSCQGSRRSLMNI